MRYGLGTVLVVLAIGPPAIYCVVRGGRFGGNDLGTAWLFWLALGVWFLVWRGTEWWQFARKSLVPELNRCLKKAYESSVTELRQRDKRRWMATGFAMGFAFAVAIWLAGGIALR